MASANKNNKPAAPAIIAVPQEDIDAAVAALSPPAPKVEELAGGTIRETNIAYEDRTTNPARDHVVEYESESVEIGDLGTILTTYGEPVGGFPKKAE